MYWKELFDNTTHTCHFVFD